MDSITHLVLGAVIGHSAAGEVSRKKAMILGALGQSLPDIDFAAGLWLNPADNLLAHRGFTHSILFAVAISYLLALSFERSNRERKVGIKFWFFFFALQTFVHLLIDVMNVYGVGLLEPFDHARFSLNVLFVADPLFSIWPIVALIGLLVSSSKYWRRTWSLIGIAGAIFYVVSAFAIKQSIESHIKESFSKLNVTPIRHLVTPTPLNTLLWYIVAEKKEGYLIGYRSIFDSDQVKFKFFPRRDYLLDRLHQYEDVHHLRRFSQGYYVIRQEGPSTVFNDIRFGQVFGWIDPDAPFAFQYYLEQPDTNVFVLQRGRFTQINRANVTGTLRRIWRR